jgi:hypothetical protein
MTRLFPASLGALALLAPAIAGAAQYAYPAKGQDAATQARDQAECSTWATGQTGFDPAKAPKTPTPTINSAETTALMSTLASGLGGATGKSGSGLGAAASLLGGGNSSLGGLGGAASMLAGMQGQGVQSNTAAAAAPGPQVEFDHARAACLTARGYSVQ